MICPADPLACKLAHAAMTHSPIFCGFVAGLLTLQREKDAAYGLTLVWSLIAVCAQHKHVQGVMIVSVIGIVLLSVASAAAIVQKQRQKQYSPMHGGLGEALQG